VTAVTVAAAEVEMSDQSAFSSLSAVAMGSHQHTHFHQYQWYFSPHLLPHAHSQWKKWVVVAAHAILSAQWQQWWRFNTIAMAMSNESLHSQ
jgi:hypothetical protein